MKSSLRAVLDGLGNVEPPGLLATLVALQVGWSGHRAAIAFLPPDDAEFVGGVVAALLAVLIITLFVIRVSKAKQ